MLHQFFVRKNLAREKSASCEPYGSADEKSHVYVKFWKSQDITLLTDIRVFLLTSYGVKEITEIRSNQFHVESHFELNTIGFQVFHSELAHSGTHGLATQ